MNDKLLRARKMIFGVSVVLCGYIFSTQIVCFPVKSDTKREVKGQFYGKTSVTGKACVITSPADYTLVEYGSIVVVGMTAQEHEAALKKCSAIITDLGDEHSHAVTFGAAHGVPVLVGTSCATSVIKHGATISIEMDAYGRGVVNEAVTSQVIIKQSQQFIASASESAKSNTLDITVTINERMENYCPTKEVVATPQKEVRSLVFVSPELLHQKFNEFVEEVKHTRHELGLGRRLPTWVFKRLVRTTEKCDKNNEDFIFSCIKVSYKFFDKSFDWIKEKLTILDIDKVNAILAECSTKPNDLNWLAVVSYKQHINAVELPTGFNKQAVLQNPDLYAQIVDAGKVNEDVYSACIIAGLFARACVKNKWV
jgi:phosphohistidine swiveling domain-containing protein